MVMYTDRFRLYKTAVVDAYLRKKINPQMPWLIKSTRSSIKRWCCQLAEAGVDKHDEKTLREYLDLNQGDHDFSIILRRRDEQDFRGFQEFLNKTETNTSVENVELLAWMIDFPLRPYSKYLEANKEKTNVIEKKNDIFITVAEDKMRDADHSGDTQEYPELLTPDEEIDIEPVDERHTQPEVTAIEPIIPPAFAGLKNKWLLIGCGLVFVAGAIWISTEKKCMYWDNDHYIATSCSVPRVDTPLVRLDPVKLSGFRRLHKVDTLTYYSVDKLWYVRVGEIIEVYSAYGKHPLYPNKKLAPLTYYAVNVCQKQHGY